ncbi:MAG TPA: rod shape-determining protein MreC [Alphaproteobacteria bacterium]|nr:rod shape-determining protein MreC [Alphaproteobacteria bacterium]
MEYRRPGLITRLATPFRGMGQRFIFGSLVIAGFGVMLLGSSDSPVVERVRAAVADVATPVLETVMHPVQAVERGIANIQELASLRSENARLRQEGARLRAWQGAAQKLAAENAAFRDMLNYKGPERFSFVTARVIADGRGPFVRSILVNAGSRAGVAKGQAATAYGRLIGRVTLAGKRSARVLLLTDLNSRIPVIVAETRTRAILIGDNSPRPRLGFLPDTDGLAQGQRVVTSGHGGVLPPGLPVGRVAAAEGGAYRVELLVNLDRLEYLQIVKFRTVGAPDDQAKVRTGGGGRK